MTEQPSTNPSTSNPANIIRTAGVTACLGGCILLFMHQPLIDTLSRYTARQDLLTLRFYALVFMLIAVGVVCILGCRLLSDAFINFIMKDPYSRSYEVITAHIFLIGLFVGMTIGIVAFFKKQLGVEHLYMEDNVTENVTLILYLWAAIFLLIRSRFFRTVGCRASSLTAVFIAGIFLVIAMEEISWGQRLFGWRTPDVLIELNRQDEMNFHNIWNDLFGTLYRLLAVLPVGVILAGIWLHRSRGNSLHGVGLWIPHPSLLGIAIVISIWSIDPFGPRYEVQELCISMMAFLYAVRIHFIANDHSALLT